MTALTQKQLENGRCSARSVSQVVGIEIVSTWMPTLAGYPIAKDGKPIQLETRDEAVAYAQEAKKRMREKRDGEDQDETSN